MFNRNTWAMLASPSSVPRGAVRGRNISNPASTSTAPRVISYGCELPTCSHSTEAGLKSPKDRSSADGGGDGIWVGTSLANP